MGILSENKSATLKSQEMRIKFSKISHFSCLTNDTKRHAFLILESFGHFPHNNHLNSENDESCLEKQTKRLISSSV